MHEITEIEHDAIMAGLRLLQAAIVAGKLSADIADVATNAGLHPMLSATEIDTLCIDINTGPYQQIV